MNPTYSKHNTEENEKEIERLPVDPAAANEFVSGEVASWEGVHVQEQTANGRVVFWLNNHCLGYLQDPPGELATAKLKFSKQILNDLVTSGRVRDPLIREDEASGWVTTPMGTVSEVAFAIELFQHNYREAKRYW